MLSNTGDSRILFDLCEPHNVQDDIGMAYGRKLRTMVEEAVISGNAVLKSDVVHRLINRYRILLSRTRRGLIVYVEDVRTSEALLQSIGHR